MRGTGTDPAHPSLAVVGHIDEIGVHITHIDDEGFLRFGQVGGWDPVQLVGQRIVLATRDGEVRGVIGRKAIHQLEDDERKRAPELKGLHIDIGAASGDDARDRVRIGDTGVIDVQPLELPNDLRGLALAGQPRRLLRGRARGAAGGRERRRLRGRARARGRPGGDRPQRRAHGRVPARAGCRDRRST